jgi:hypothetical protein
MICIEWKDDSVFQLRRPYDLMSLLHQENRAQMLSTIKNQLIAQKEEIESDSNSNNGINQSVNLFIYKLILLLITNFEDLFSLLWLQK